MAFLNPLFLAGLAAVSVPILLHLLRRRESRFLIFPALRYLTRTTQEHAQIIRLRQLLLLALRVLAVLLLVSAGARMVLPIGGRDHPPAGIVLVIDNGLTSGGIVGEARLLDSLVARAGEALDRAGSRDRVWIVPVGEPWRPSLPMTPTEARAALGELGHSDVGSDVTAAIARAGALLDAAAPELREIVVLSDLRPEAVPAPAPGGDPRADPVTIAPPPTGSRPSRGVRAVRISGGLAPRAGDPGEIQVEVIGTDAVGAVVRVYLSDRLVATGTVEANGTAVLPLPPVAAGWVEGRVELDPDDLRADDTAHFAFRAIAAPGIATAGSLAPELFDALSVLADAGRVRTASSADADVHIVGAGAIRLPPSPAGIVVVPPADPALLPAVNRLLEDAAPGWRFELLAAGTGTEREVATGPLLASLPTHPRVRMAYRIVPGGAAGGWTELLSLSDGEPWLVRAETPSGGTLLVLGSPFVDEASDLPTSAAMIPFLDLLTSLPVGEPGGDGARAGDPLPAPAGAVAVRTPSEATRPLGGTSWWTETGETGIYRFQDARDETVERIAVNAEPRGTDSSLTPEAAADRLRSRWEAVRPAERWPETVLEGRTGREVSRPLAALLVLVLLAEGWLARSAVGDRGDRLGIFRTPSGEQTARAP